MPISLGKVDEEAGKSLPDLFDVMVLLPDYSEHVKLNVLTGKTVASVDVVGHFNLFTAFFESLLEFVVLGTNDICRYVSDEHTKKCSA